jgi:hypothetical protein
MSDPAASPTTDLKDTLEEMRASVAARGARKGLAGAIEKAILGLLEMLMALLADFRAGRLAAVSAVADGADGAVAHRVKPEDAGNASLSHKWRGRYSLRLARSRHDWAGSRPNAERRGRCGCLPLTLPHRAPFLPAKMGTRRGPLPLPQGERERKAPRFSAPFAVQKWPPTRSPAAFAAVVGYARHSPRSPTLRGTAGR